MGERYYNGREGRRFVYSTRALERCPYAMLTETAGGALLEENGPAAERVKRAAVVLEAPHLYAALRHAHRAARHLPIVHAGECRVCGARMVRPALPWLVHVEELRGVFSEIRDRRAFGLKREAIEWARETAELDRRGAYVPPAHT